MNPFRETVAADAWADLRSDVPKINQHVFEECLRGVEHVRAAGRSAAILIHGPAGGGKTHLLSRLRQHLSLKLPTATDRKEALFVWVRLQTSPRMIWRTVRRTLVNDWFRPLNETRSQFDRILFHRLAEIRVAEGDLEPWYEYMLESDPDGLKALIDQIAAKLDLDRNTHTALEHLALGRHRRDLRAWLCGDSLPESALDRLELTQEDGIDEEREDEAQRVVLMLCRLAGDALPIVLSIDQVEALETNPTDREALFAFGQLVSTLHDGTTNLLIVSAVQSSFAERLTREARAADRDRMTSLGKGSIEPLNRQQADELIRTRLAADKAPANPDAASQRFWPLNEADLADLFSSGAATPRNLLARCAARFDSLRLPLQAGGLPAPTPEASLSGFLSEKWESVVDEKLKSNQPHLTEDILRHSLPMVAKLVDRSVKTAIDEELKDVSLILQGDSGRTGVSVCTQSNMTSLAARLKRLKSQHDLRRLDRLVVIRDSRVPLSPLAKAAQTRLSELQQQGAVLVHPTPEVLAALDALRALLSDARSGDLAFQGETVRPQTVEEWLTAHLSNPLREFVQQIVGEPLESGDGHADGVRIEKVNTVLAKHPVIMLEDMAEQIGIPLGELSVLIRRHPELYGRLGEAGTVVFRVTATANRS